MAIKPYFKAAADYPCTTENYQTDVWNVARATKVMTPKGRSDEDLLDDLSKAAGVATTHAREALEYLKKAP